MKIRLSTLKKLIKEAIISDYDVSSRPSGPLSMTPIPEWEAPQVMGAWGKHAANRYELMFYLQSGTVAEKTQASHELEICDRKMAFWERHDKFDPTEARRIVDRLAGEWEMPPIPIKRPSTVGPAATSQRSAFPNPSTMAAPGTPGAKRVTHKTFGAGTIVKKLDGDKVMVIFDDKKLGGAAKTLSMSFLTPV